LSEEGVFGLQDILYRGAMVALGKAPPDAAAYCQANLNAFWNRILSAQDEDERRGLMRVLSVVDPAAHMMQWYQSAAGRDPKRARKLARLRHRPAFLRMIDALTDREYEALACVAMKVVGASEVTLTPSGTEGGVDFFALVSSPARCHLFAGSTNPIRIIGQSKKFTNPVGVDKMKEFLTTITEVKHRGEPKTERIVPPWFRAARGPIVGCMIAHRGFQSGATSRARNHGIITADSLDLAEMLALSRGIPDDLDAGARIAECLSRTRNLLV
jgi:hypothetical protein